VSRPSERLPKLLAGPRRRKELIEEAGAKVLGWEMSGSNQVKFRLQLPSGTRMLICPNTPSDKRGEKNMVALVRRWLAEPAMPAEPTRVPADAAR
jgi:hypothetical protein